MKSFVQVMAIALLMAGCKPTVQESTLPYLFTRTDQKGALDLEKDIAFVNGYYATADLRLLQSGKADSLRMLTPQGEDITLVKRRVDRHEQSTDWYGEVVGHPGAWAMITYTKSALNGLLKMGGKTYRMVHAGKDIYQVALLDTRKLQDCGEKEEAPYMYPEEPEDQDATGCPDPDTDIDIMVLYTSAALTGAGSVEAMEATIYQSMALTNLAYENSDVFQRVHLVHLAEATGYTEAGDADIDRDRLTDPADGFLDDVPAIRDAHGADIVALIVETSTSANGQSNCGFGNIMGTVSSAHAARAFCTIKRSCAVSNISFPHELGHVMGCRHDSDPTNTPFTFVHGFNQPSPADGTDPGWRTIMSKDLDLDRQVFFSNPGQVFSPTNDPVNTDPRGDATIADNHRTLNSTAATVANFRCSSPNNADVWMKDAWEDTGLEPDPATAGLPMYRSPYIWVRHAQDPTFQHQHEHENPVFGATNWIYVKMHNGGPIVQNGNLELYIADASVSLTWPASWTLVATLPANLAATTTTILEQQWNNVPDPSTGSTHYCMIARWVSTADPMHTAEGPDIGVNVRENNNIVWRNLNVVDLGGDADVAMAIAGQGRKQTRLVWWDANVWPKPKFTASGTVTITLDDALIQAWKAAQGTHTGVRIDGNKLVMNADRGVLEGLVLPPDYKGLIKVHFAPSANTPRTTFDFRVQHWIGEGDKAVLLGGVDYELVKK